MKKSIRKLTPQFSTNRMLWEYVEKYYLPAARQYKRLSEKGLARAKEVARWRAQVQTHWHGVRVESVSALCEQLETGLMARGHGDEDMSALARSLREMAGIDRG